MALDNGRLHTNKPLPTPADAPYQLPSRADTRQSSRAGWYSPWPSITSPQSHVRTDSSGHARHDSKENTNDDKPSIMDARRFTPNLHASLISEILSLRREIESKDDVLTSLEETLQNCKDDNSHLTATINSQERELRSAKKQIQLLESGTLSALEDLAKERDDAVGNLTDVRKRLEASKNESRAREDDARRNQMMWEQDKQNWDNERRNMERKVHVVEGRLKTMVNEVATVQAHSQLASVAGSDIEEGIGDTWFSNWSDIISTRSSSVRGRYHLSELSTNTYDTHDLANLRNPNLATRNSMGGLEPNSLSLAEELNFEETSEDQEAAPDFVNEIFSPDALLEENPFRPRRFSIQSQDYKARKILGLAIDSTEQSLGRESIAEQGAGTILKKPSPSLQAEKELPPTHQDAGTQFSPSSSPKVTAPEPKVVLEKDFCRNSNTENTANQRRKRISAAAISHESWPSKSDSSSGSNTASTACQTVAQPVSPPLVPMIALEPLFPEPSTIPSREMISSSTQTDGGSPSTNGSAGTRHPPSSKMVPVIAIHPPTSKPGSSYNNMVLPPRTKNISCQTMPSPISLTSVSTQTEGIRVDKRPLKVPPRLMSAAASAKPQVQLGQQSRGAIVKRRRDDLKNPPPVQAPWSRTRPSDIQIRDSHVAKFSDRPINKAKTVLSTSPTKSDNPFAGFSDQELSEKEIDFSDDDDFAAVAPIRKTLSKVHNSWKLIPASMNASLGPRPLGRPISDIQEIDDTTEAGTNDIQAGVGRKPTGPIVRYMGQDEKAAVPTNAPQISDMRKAALISSGALAHTRQRSPSEPGPSTVSNTVPPPFPVPTRSSSRKIPISSSEGNGSPTPYSTSFIGGIRNRTKAPPASRNPLRKVRSAAAVPKFAPKIKTTDGTDSPTATSQASTPLGSPRLPRMLRSESTSQHSTAPPHKAEQQTPVSGLTASEPAISSPGQTMSVVDAIAQTMVGEWMLKYVRKRKSFGITGSPQVEFEEARSNSESNSGIRHKRWVWLAPYERAVIWSSKQPTNGSALLGKGGRKLTIQSVLDIKDDTPMPKNASLQCNPGRSILILTPERALRFTAPNQQRHYIWLTAISFLCHSTLGMGDLASIPAVPQAEYQLPSSQARGHARRSPRDSIRIAKAKERPNLQGRNYSSPMGTENSMAVKAGSAFDKENESVSDAAEPPQIPRVYAHTRRRSNTGPRPSLQSAFHSFPAHMGMSSSHNVRNATPPDMVRSVTKGFRGSGPGLSNMRLQSETAIIQPEAIRNDFFDAVGTVRMEAFVDSSKQEEVSTGKSQSLPRSSYRTRHGCKKDMSYWGIMGETSNVGASAAQGKKSARRAEDVFEGV
ncbi:MAG: hypothetical protein Q9170_004982 [Blastenia crenularia]